MTLAYEKFSFKQEGILRDSLYYNGEFSDEIIMVILQKEYNRLATMQK